MGKEVNKRNFLITTAIAAAAVVAGTSLAFGFKYWLSRPDDTTLNSQYEHEQGSERPPSTDFVNDIYINKGISVSDLNRNISSLEGVLDDSSVRNLSPEESERNVLDNLVEVVMYEDVPFDPSSLPVEVPEGIITSAQRMLSKGHGIQITNDGFVLVPYNVIQLSEKDWKLGNGGNSQTDNRRYTIEKKRDGGYLEYNIDTSFWAVDSAHNIALIKADISQEQPERSYFKIGDGEVVNGQEIKLFSSFDSGQDPIEFDCTIYSVSHNVKPPTRLSEKHDFLYDLFLADTNLPRGESLAFVDSQGAFMGFSSVTTNKDGKRYEGGIKAKHGLSLIQDAVHELRKYK